MKKILFVAAALALTLSPAVAATPPTAEQKAEFLSQCLKNSDGNTTLCTCKAEQAMKLIDTDFMKIVLATMKGGALPLNQSKSYGIYVSKSNAVCAPGM